MFRISSAARATLRGGRSYLLLTATAALAACGSGSGSDDAAAAIVHNDFEQLAGWMPATPSLTTDFAHSGRYAIKVGGDLDYSLSYAQIVGDISPKRFSRVRLSGWAYLTDPAAGAVVLSLALHDPAHDHQQIFGAGVPLGEQVKTARQWTHVSKEIELPATMAFSHQLRIYLWKAGSPAVAYLDDVRVEVLK